MKLGNGTGTVYKLSGKRRNSYIVRKTVGWTVDKETGKAKQIFKTIGYAPTKTKGLEMLMNYNSNPYDVDAAKITFAEVYERWSAEKYPTVSESNVKGYRASYKCFEMLNDKLFKDIKLTELQYVVDNCGKNYPTLRKIKVFLSQIYAYAMKYEFCVKDYSKYVDIVKFKHQNPNSKDRTPFNKHEIDLLWEQSKNEYVQIVLMLIYSGVRISELLDLKKENVNLEEHCFDVIKSKTESGIRKVPIADKVYDFYVKRYNEDSKYLIHTPNGRKFVYRNYYDSYWKPALEIIDAEYHRPHDTRHTCISMLAEAEVSQTVIKKIVGHSGAMSLTERVYTHLNIQELLTAINKI